MKASPLTAAMILAGIAILATGCTADVTPPTDLDGLAASDARFDPTNRQLLAWQPPDGSAVGVDRWETGTQLILGDGTVVTLAGLADGVCPDYARDLMTWLTEDRQVIVEPVGETGSAAYVWILDGDTGAAQLANALAVRFGVGRADGTDHARAGLLEDETSAVLAGHRPETLRCIDAE